MKGIILLISLLLTLLLIAVLYYVIRTKIASGDQVHQRLKDLQGEGERVIKSRKDELSRIPFLERTVMPLFSRLEKFLMRFAPSEIHATIEKKLVLAGKQGKWSASRIISIWLACQAVFLGIAIYTVSRNTFTYVSGIVLVWLCLLIGALLPFVYLNSIIRKRQKVIEKQLPEVLDLLSISVQAGLSFDGALRKLTDRMKGPLIEEFQHMQQEVRMGSPRTRALQAVAKRCDLEDVYLFITAVVQAERLGTSIGQTLINQADNMRERRRQKAKAAALKAPIKMLFPLVLFIFPALFVVILVPPIFSIIRNAGMLR